MASQCDFEKFTTSPTAALRNMLGVAEGTPRRIIPDPSVNAKGAEPEEAGITMAALSRN
jgi:hypothetical protein